MTTFKISRVCSDELAEQIGTGYKFDFFSLLMQMSSSNADEEGWFTARQETLAEWGRMSLYKIKQATNKLIELDLIETDMRHYKDKHSNGTPNKIISYRLKLDNILKLGCGDLTIKALKKIAKALTYYSLKAKAWFKVKLMEAIAAVESSLSVLCEPQKSPNSKKLCLSTISSYTNLYKYKLLKKDESDFLGKLIRKGKERGKTKDEIVAYCSKGLTTKWSKTIQSAGDWIEQARAKVLDLYDQVVVGARQTSTDSGDLVIDSSSPPVIDGKRVLSHPLVAREFAYLMDRVPAEFLKRAADGLWYDIRTEAKIGGYDYVR